MSLLTASTAIVFFFGFAAAQITAPTCSPTWKWVCILSSPQCVLWPLLDLIDFFVQSFNSLSQDPCLMTAYMYSTCSGGCESFPCYFCLALMSLIVSSHFQRTKLIHCRRDTITPARGKVLTNVTCASAVPSDIRS
jgi:hypothetical protein